MCLAGPGIEPAFGLKYNAYLCFIRFVFPFYIDSAGENQFFLFSLFLISETKQNWGQ